jgi:hypothetical protein
MGFMQDGISPDKTEIFKRVVEEMDAGQLPAQKELSTCLVHIDALMVQHNVLPGQSV